MLFKKYMYVYPFTISQFYTNIDQHCALEQNITNFFIHSCLTLRPPTPSSWFWERANQIHTLYNTCLGNRMSRASASRSGRSGNPNLVNSNPDIAGSNPDRVTFKLILVWRSALLGQGKDWLAQCQDNVTEQVMMLAL